MSAIEFDRFTQQGTGYTGAVKFRTGATGGCCDCSTSDSSVIVFYSDGAVVDLWTCNGCRCLQMPVGPLDLPPKTPMALHPGATLPEEVCSSCCYQRSLADGDGGFAGAWDASKALGEVAIDQMQLSFVNAELQKQVEVLTKQAAQQTTAQTVQTAIVLDPIEAYLKDLETAAC